VEFDLKIIECGATKQNEGNKAKKQSKAKQSRTSQSQSQKKKERCAKKDQPDLMITAIKLTQQI